MAAVWAAAAALEPAPPLAPGVAVALDDDASLADCTRWDDRPDGSRRAVTLFAVHPDDLKEVVYTMRFDLASSVYAEFGPFYTGMVVAVEELVATL